MSGADVEVYLSQVHDGSVSSGFRALYEERLLLDVTLLIEEHHFQVNCWLARFCQEAADTGLIRLRLISTALGPLGVLGNKQSSPRTCSAPEWALVAD